MDSALAFSPRSLPLTISNVPSLDNLLESEVIIGDEDASSSTSFEEETADRRSSLRAVEEGTKSSSHPAASLESAGMQMEPLSLPSQPTPPVTPRSSSTASSARGSRSSPLNSGTPRPGLRKQPSYAESTTSSKNRASPPTVTLPRRSASAAPTPTTTRKTPPTPPPKPAKPLVRQTSMIRTKVSETPVSPRKTKEPVAVKPLATLGRQHSILKNGKPTATEKTPTTPKKDDRFATIGKRTKVSSPYAADKDTKNTADKFATLPRRKPKERPSLPRTDMSMSLSLSLQADKPLQSMSPDSFATLPRPVKNKMTPTGTKPALPPKPKTLIYMEKNAQTALTMTDIQEGQDAILKLRSLSRGYQSNEDEMKRARVEIEALQQELDEEREERRLVQQELERTTMRVAAMLDSMEGVEREFQSRGNSLVHLESSLQVSTHTVLALQEQIEAQDAALTAQRLELDRSLAAQNTLLQQLRECEVESREMMEFLQAEKATLNDSLRDSETENSRLQNELSGARQQLQQQQEECVHLVRLAEQRRHEIAALEKELRGVEGKSGSVLLAQGAQLSAAAVSLSRLTSRMEKLLHQLVTTHSLPAVEIEAIVFNNDAYNSTDEDYSGADATPPEFAEVPASDINEPHREEDETNTEDSNSDADDRKEMNFFPLVGSISLQDLSDAINLSRRRPPEGREETRPQGEGRDNKPLAASVVDQIDEADHALSKLLRVLRRLLHDKDQAVQQLTDEKEQLVSSLSAQSIALKEAREELALLRNEENNQEQMVLKDGNETLISLSPNGEVYETCNLNKRRSWNERMVVNVSQVLDSLPKELLHSYPALLTIHQQLQNVNVILADPNANGSG